eukprot:Trichotokara_eunicae@DN3408_c0_g1_i3.p1
MLAEAGLPSPMFHDDGGGSSRVLIQNMTTATSQGNRETSKQPTTSNFWCHRRNRILTYALIGVTAYVMYDYMTYRNEGTRIDKAIRANPVLRASDFVSSSINKKMKQ